jgi:hypothetical protein
MIVENFETALRSFARRKPFQPYLVEFASGGVVQIDHPEAVALRDGLAVFRRPDGTFTLFDCHGVTRLEGISESRSQGEQQP